MGAVKTERSWIGRKYRTRENLDAAISRFIMRAEQHERKRDALAFESPEYWSEHDKAMALYEKASELMPK